MILFINFPLFFIYSIHYQITSSSGIHSDSGVFFPSSKSSLNLMICVKKIKNIFSRICNINNFHVYQLFKYIIVYAIIKSNGIYIATIYKDTI